MKSKYLTIGGMSESPGYCPFCAGAIWGEGWDPKTGVRFYSHVRDELNDICCFELSLQGPPGPLRAS